ncbi:hypothetical protein MTO96_017316 [Rhipicephalus appendiculatus]
MEEVEGRWGVLSNDPHGPAGAGATRLFKVQCFSCLRWCTSISERRFGHRVKSQDRVGGTLQQARLFTLLSPEALLRQKTALKETDGEENREE